VAPDLARHQILGRTGRPRPFHLEVDLERGETGLIFPDFLEIVSWHEGFLTEAECRDLARDALMTALACRIQANDEIPDPSPVRGDGDGFVIDIDPLVALKLSLYRDFRASGLSRRELAKRMNKNEVLVRRMLDIDHPSSVEQLNLAIALGLGRKFVVDVRTEAA
jgi:antitoxin HicB